MHICSAHEKHALGLNRGAGRQFLALSLFLTLTACASERVLAPPPIGSETMRGPVRPAATRSEEMTRSKTIDIPTSPTEKVADLIGWANDDHLAAFLAFHAGCKVVKDTSLRSVCRAADAAIITDDDQARRFFERHFRVETLPGEGVLTGYFAPVYPARASRDAEFTAPVRPPPPPSRRIPLMAMSEMDRISPAAVIDGRTTPALAQTATKPTLNGAEDHKDARSDIDPIGGLLDPDPTQDLNPAPPMETNKSGQSIPLRDAERAVIEQASEDDALAWMRPEDLFFMQIQGSGVLVFPDGQRRRAAFAGDNGKPFVGIARTMVHDGLLPRNGASGDSIRRWLSEHAGPDAQQVMRKNPRYVFFRISDDVLGEPLGAAGVPLPPGRAIAMDSAHHVFGVPYWIDAEAPILSGALPQYHRLAVALDTGGAIRGPIRADLYFGTGDAAGREAGRVRHVLRLARLVPVDTGASESDDASTARSRGR